ncbi:cytochrome c biogenesis protein ResB [Congregicoccus parvus]|uniref:cytochrome c biogenesis protein ResB n=1 Tax=Congregicoccus parvus TaxID=3081749 RepID=UPI003FA5CCBD
MSRPRPSPLEAAIGFVTSLQLTIVCLAIGMVLIFVGTLAQVQLGIDQALKMYFHSFIVWWSPPDASWRIPIMPGGFLVGGVLLINLVAAHFYRFTWTWRKSGIWLVHVGIIVLLLGELFTAALSRESALRLSEGETKNFSEAYRGTELAVIDHSLPDRDRVLAVAEDGLAAGKSIQHPALPFRIQVHAFYGNSRIIRRGSNTGALPAPLATQGMGTDLTAQETERTPRMDERDISAAWIEIFVPEGSLGTWMVSNVFQQRQGFTYAGRDYSVELRQQRHYKPYAITLLDFTHDRYPGTEIPRNFSSRVRLVDPTRGEDRELLIYMNHPLRHDGLTFYQSGYEGEFTTILQVVKNPSRHLPYISCILVGLGLVVQFSIHLTGFVRRRKSLPATP